MRFVYIYFPFAWANVNIKFNAMDARAHDSWESWLHSWILLPSITVRGNKLFQTIIEWKLYRIGVARFANRFICFLLLYHYVLISISSTFKALHTNFSYIHSDFQWNLRKWSFSFHPPNFMLTKYQNWRKLGNKISPKPTPKATTSKHRQPYENWQITFDLINGIIYLRSSSI